MKIIEQNKMKPQSLAMVRHDNRVDASNDILGRRDLAKEISAGLIRYSNSCSEGITISITGEWGAGKSTLLVYVKDLLLDYPSKDIKLIEFNPWVFQNEGSIKEAFLVHFAISLNSGESKITKVSKNIYKFIKYFRWLKYLNTAAGSVQEGLEGIMEQFSEKETIGELKKEMDRILEKNNKKIFVFIDDVDRLKSSEIIELFQTISLVANFKNVFYVVAFDKDIVVTSLEKEFDKRGIDYLEKIIQIDYSIPKIKNEKIDSLFFDGVKMLEGEFSVKFNRRVLDSLWDFHGLRQYFTTLRDIKRYFNSLLFRMPAIKDDINVIDLLALEAIRLFDFEGYENIYNCFSTNLRKRELPEHIFSEEQLNSFTFPTKDIINALTPKSTLAFIRDDINERRVFDFLFFERYFSLLRNETDVSELDFRDIIEDRAKRIFILRKSRSNSTIESILRKLRDPNIYRYYPLIDYSLVEDLVFFFNGDAGLFEKWSDQVLDVIVNILCKSKSRNRHIEKFYHSFKQDSWPSFVHIYFLYIFHVFIRDNRYLSDCSEFDDYYKNNFDKILSWSEKGFENSVSALIKNNYSIECPKIKSYFFLLYSTYFKSDYLKIQNELFADLDFDLHILSEWIYLYDSLELRSYDFGNMKLFFPDDTFLNFYERVSRIELPPLAEVDQARVKAFLNLDISEYPKLSEKKGNIPAK